MSEAKCETGWGDGLSTQALFDTRDCHPTPTLRVDPSKGLAMLIRSEKVGVRSGAAEAAPAISAASLPTLLLGGLLLLIGP